MYLSMKEAGKDGRAAGKEGGKQVILRCRGAGDR